MKSGFKFVFSRLKSRRGVGIELAITLALVFFTLIGLILTLTTVYHSRILKKQQQITERLDIERIFEDFRGDPKQFKTDGYIGYDVFVSDANQEGYFTFLIFKDSSVVFKSTMVLRPGTAGETEVETETETEPGTDVPKDIFTLAGERGFCLVSRQYKGDETDRLGEKFLAALQNDALEVFDAQAQAIVAEAKEESAFYGAQVLRLDPSPSESTLLVTRDGKNLFSVTIRKQEADNAHPYRVIEWTYGELLS